MVNREWISVANAAALMGVCKRQALRRLARSDAEFGGRLLRRLGDKRMPRGVQASKYLVSVAVLRVAMHADEGERDIETLRLEVIVLRQQLTALRRAVLRLLRLESVADEP